MDGDVGMEIYHNWDWNCCTLSCKFSWTRDKIVAVVFYAYPLDKLKMHPLELVDLETCYSLLQVSTSYIVWQKYFHEKHSIAFAYYSI